MKPVVVLALAGSLFATAPPAWAVDYCMSMIPGQCPSHSPTSPDGSPNLKSSPRPANGDSSAVHTNQLSSYTLGNGTYYSNGVTSYQLGNNEYYSNGTRCYTLGNSRHCE